tara:strand:+ start:102 stop:290 length:189 start_codon:yes stop_codon:yes gene_type:complete
VRVWNLCSQTRGSELLGKKGNSITMSLVRETKRKRKRKRKRHRKRKRKRKKKRQRKRKWREQ